MSEIVYATGETVDDSSALLAQNDDSLISPIKNIEHVGQTDEETEEAVSNLDLSKSGMNDSFFQNIPTYEENNKSTASVDIDVNESFRSEDSQALLKRQNSETIEETKTWIKRTVSLKRRDSIEKGNTSEGTTPERRFSYKLEKEKSITLTPSFVDKSQKKSPSSRSKTAMLEVTNTSTPTVVKSIETNNENIDNNISSSRSPKRLFTSNERNPDLVPVNKGANDKEKENINIYESVKLKTGGLEALEQKERERLQKLEESKRNVTTEETSSPSPVPKDIVIETIPYELLVKKMESKDCQGLALGELEKHLSDDDFLRVFKLTRVEFYKIPLWKQKDHKRKAKIF